MKGKILIILLITPLLVTATIVYLTYLPTQSHEVNITGINHEILFSNINPPSPSDTLFSANSLPSKFALKPGGIFEDNISFFSVPSLQNFEVTNITVASPDSSGFSIVEMNRTLPLRISTNEIEVAVMLVIRVPDSDFSGQVVVEVTISP
ncbi:MAG TPA: hypothetical protein VFF30_10975 [Nitrososphaerales archaeon]|nr:hypothetical protein [Nitrososphaerales archaeon]